MQYPGAKNRPPLKKAFETVGRHYEQYAPGRNTPNPLIKRYPNGTLDIRSVAGAIVKAILRVKDYAQGGYSSGDILMPTEKALLSIIFPGEDPGAHFAAVHTRLTPAEAAAVREEVNSELKEIKAYAGGRGRGQNPGAKLTVDLQG